VIQVQIIILDRLDQHWSEWFEGLNISYLEGDRTLMSGIIMDQTALYTLLDRLYRLGLPLESVSTLPISKEPTDR
jgi:hypothetical protein